MLLIITSNSDKICGGVNIDDLEWPWTPQIGGFRCFLQLVAAAHANLKRELRKMDGDRPRQPANRNFLAVAHLTSFAQITCYLCMCYHSVLSFVNYNTANTSYDIWNLYSLKQHQQHLCIKLQRQHTTIKKVTDRTASQTPDDQCCLPCST